MSNPQEYATARLNYLQPAAFESPSEENLGNPPCCDAVSAYTYQGRRPPLMISRDRQGREPPENEGVPIETPVRPPGEASGSCDTGGGGGGFFRIQPQGDARRGLLAALAFVGEVEAYAAERRALRPVENRSAPAASLPWTQEPGPHPAEVTGRPHERHIDPDGYLPAVFLPEARQDPNALLGPPGPDPAAALERPDVDSGSLARGLTAGCRI
jgi:hypothetical protein